MFDCIKLFRLPFFIPKQLLLHPHVGDSDVGVYCYVLFHEQIFLTYAIPMDAVALVFLSKLFVLQFIIHKSEIVQKIDSGKL